jgi:hypothetical protein
MNTEAVENESEIKSCKKDLCEECGYYRPLKFKSELAANLCELCYDLPIK